MKNESRLLKHKAIASLGLSTEQLKSGWDVGWLEAALMLLEHSFEVLLKAAILCRGGEIRDRGQKNPIGFDASVRRALPD
jgi:hypothetical protein